jgi:hypothetical protein
MTTTYTCSYCPEPAQFYIRVNKSLKPVCLKHYQKIKARREKEK